MVVPQSDATLATSSTLPRSEPSDIGSAAPKGRADIPARPAARPTAAAAAMVRTAEEATPLPPPPPLPAPSRREPPPTPPRAGPATPERCPAQASPPPPGPPAPPRLCGAVPGPALKGWGFDRRNARSGVAFKPTANMKVSSILGNAVEKQ